MSYITELKNSCNDSIITQDTNSFTIDIDITNQNDNCHVVYSVERSSLSGFKGTSMTCDIPISKTDVMTQPYLTISMELFKYCEGSFKDLYLKDLSNMFGFG